TPRQTRSRRHIPAAVKRAVDQRDGRRCTFVSDAGHRCESRTLLQYDHIHPVARGGTATVENIRLRCRTHNQFEAEQAFGTGFMDSRREEARRVRTHRVAQAAATRAAEPHAAAADAARARAAISAAEVVPWLRSLGLRADEAQRA